MKYAIPDLSDYVRFREDRCTGCAACLRTCPTGAIRIRQHKSIRIVGQCIGCGACIRACPAGAVAAATGKPDYSGSDHAAIAMVSPVLYAQFAGAMPGGILLGLRQLGFRHTIDLSFFLEMFQRAAEEFIRRNRDSRLAPWPLISPVCPVVVRLIAFKFPSLLAHILPVLRPVALMAREVQERVLPEYAARGEKPSFTTSTPARPSRSRSPDRSGRRRFKRRRASASTKSTPPSNRGSTGSSPPIRCPSPAAPSSSKPVPAGTPPWGP